MSKLLVLALVTAFFVFGKADFATLQEQTEDELAMSRSRLSNLELFLKEDPKTKDLYQEVKKKCDDVELQYGLLAVEIVKLREKEDLKGDAFEKMHSIKQILVTEATRLNMLFHNKKDTIKTMLHDKVTHDVIMTRWQHGVKKLEHFQQKLKEFEEFANKP